MTHQTEEKQQRKKKEKEKGTEIDGENMLYRVSSILPVIHYFPMACCMNEREEKEVCEVTETSGYKMKENLCLSFKRFFFFWFVLSFLLVLRKPLKYQTV